MHLSITLQWSPDSSTVDVGQAVPSIIGVAADFGKNTFWFTIMQLVTFQSRCGFLLQKPSSCANRQSAWNARSMGHAPWFLEKRNSLGICFKNGITVSQRFFTPQSAELEEIRSHGFAQPAIVLPTPSNSESRIFSYGRSNRPTALFLSRLHPKKGLVELVRAWTAAMKDSNGD